MRRRNHGWLRAAAALVGTALVCAALVVVALELLALAWIRWRFFGARYLSSLMWICFAATVIVGLSVALGTAA